MARILMILIICTEPNRNTINSLIAIPRSRAVQCRSSIESHSNRIDGENILLGCCSMKASTTALDVNSKSDRICIRFRSLSRCDAMVL